jgi:FixJ family two-component response regulator
MNASTAKIAVVDDDEAVRRSLGRLLRSAGYAVETYASADTFFAAQTPDAFACAVLDVQMPGVSGLDLHSRLRATKTAPAVVFLTGHGDIPMSVEAMKRGAVDFLTKPVDESRLLPAIDQAITRHAQAQADSEALRDLRRRLESLTTRQLEVLRCLLTGSLNKQIAAHLHITEKTVKVHRAAVLQKMGTPSLVELTRVCSLLGIEPDAQLAVGH